MKGHDLIRYAIGQGNYVLETYLSDLTDSELMTRPVEGANHPAWQLGHLISTNNRILEFIKPGSGAELPPGFEAAHARDKVPENDGGKFFPKRTYLDAMKAQRAAALALLESLSDDDFDRAAPEGMRSYAPNVGSLLVLMGTHLLLHAGQFAMVRRKLGKKIVM